jgi:hypothetical protein
MHDTPQFLPSILCVVCVGKWVSPPGLVKARFIYLAHNAALAYLYTRQHYRAVALNMAKRIDIRILELAAELRPVRCYG